MIVKGAYEQRELTCADRIASAKSYLTRREARFCALVLILGTSEGHRRNSLFYPCLYEQSRVSSSAARIRTYFARKGHRDEHDMVSGNPKEASASHIYSISSWSYLKGWDRSSYSNSTSSIPVKKSPAATYQPEPECPTLCRNYPSLHEHVRCQTCQPRSRLDGSATCNTRTKNKVLT